VGSNPIGVILFKMPLDFCNKCGGIIRNKKIDNDKSYSFCDNCQEFKLIKTGEVTTLSFNKIIEKQNEKGEGIKENINEFANYLNLCKKCGYDKAQILDLGVFYSDEDNLILLKCGKCGFCERIGRKTS
jgi:DNA-directed RNA polymerase subunit M/transcription elongation factor TFIIS